MKEAEIGMANAVGALREDRLSIRTGRAFYE